LAKIHFTHDEILARPNPRYPAPDPFQIDYHVRPARPANFCVTKDAETGEINVSAGTIGPLTWEPYTMCLHVNITYSPHTYRNLRVGGDCVVALPGRDIVKETWFTALPLPRGISELEVAGLHTCPSKFIDVPGIAECPVNFECRVEFKQDYYTHGIVFVRVLGAGIEDKALDMTREEIVRWYPTYEIDDVANEFGGSVERLGVMGEIFTCPSYPLAAKVGWGNSFARWMRDLGEEGYLGPEELRRILAVVEEYEELFPAVDNPRRRELKEFITRLAGAIVGERWEEAHAIINV
jgi:flavin reductase (DIM6/NTAB) family NADH-FMN oxidoreductase RutF